MKQVLWMPEPAAQPLAAWTANSRQLQPDLASGFGKPSLQSRDAREASVWTRSLRAVHDHGVEQDHPIHR